MKKIPTLFIREFDGHKIKNLTRKVYPGMEWVMLGDGVATEKVDGAACAIIGGKLYKRYDANVLKGRKPPNGAIPCQESADPVTGHFPHWVEVNKASNADRWYVDAYLRTHWVSADGTYEAVGLHFQGNPYDLDADYLEPHGRIKIPDFPRDYDGMNEYFRTHEIEGVVFWKNGEPQCKIKRTDFGYEWPVKNEEDGEDGRKD